MKNNLKIIIINLLKEIERGKYSNITLNEYFSKSNLKNNEKKFITEVFYGVLRNKILLDYLIKKYAKKISKKDFLYLLEISLYQEIFMKSDSAGIVWEGVEISKKIFGQNIANFINGVLRNLFKNYNSDIEELKKNKRYDIIYSYKKWQYDKISKLFGDEVENVLKSYKQIPYLSFRINKLKYSEIEFEEFLKNNNIDIIYKIGEVYYVNSGEILNSDIFKNGKIFVQDGSSYMVGKILNPSENQKILDCCAGPGTKTSHIGELMKNNGKIFALDLYEHKIKLIKQNCNKSGINIVQAEVCDARNVHLKYKNEIFDKVLADVPCSGFGVIRKKPEVIYNKEENDIKELVTIQREILDSASKVVKIGGELVYSTCTIFNEENTDNIKYFLSKNKNFNVIDIEIKENIIYEKDDLGGIKINYKNKYLDSFYIIKLKRVE